MTSRSKGMMKAFPMVSILGLKPASFLASPLPRFPVLLDSTFAVVMALNAPMVVVAIVLVVLVFGIAAMYNRRKRKAPVCRI